MVGYPDVKIPPEVSSEHFLLLDASAEPQSEQNVPTSSVRSTETMKITAAASDDFIGGKNK